LRWRTILPESKHTGDIKKMSTKPVKAYDYSLWADTAAGAIRAAFGLVWAIDTYFKWQPDFLK
jgi:hypothetical protein